MEAAGPSIAQVDGSAADLLVDGQGRPSGPSTKDGASMISLTRLSGSAFALNSDLIERVDSTPDTVITLQDGSKYVVAEDLRSVVTAIRLHRAEVIALSAHLHLTLPEGAETTAEDHRAHLATVSPHPSLQVPRSEGGS